MKSPGLQRGMTLIEAVVALGISSVILAGLGAAIYTIFNVTGRGDAEINALRDIQAVSYWISYDGRMAGAAELEDGDTGVSFSWNDSFGSPHTSTFSLSDTELIRNDGDTGTVIALYISSSEFDLSGDTLTYTIVSTPPGRWQVSRRVTGTVNMRSYGE